MGRARILVADDHIEMRTMIVQLLGRDFDMLEPVGDGRALVEKATELDPDICLIDISMPLINGIEAAAQLGKIGSTAKIIFLTIHTDRDFVHAALRTGASGYVSKSRIASDLIAAISEVLAGRVFISPPLREGISERGPC